MKKKFNCFLILFFAATAAFAQVENESPKTLDDQFQGIIQNAETYNEYKVIKSTTLSEFRKSMGETISQLETEISTLNTRISDLESEIQSLNTELNTISENAEQATFDATHITFLGIPFEKGTFKVIMLSIVAILAIAIGVGVMRFKQVNQEAKQKVLSHSALEIEFEEYKKKSFDKQIKLKRELQTEKNKNEDLRNKDNKNSKVTA